MSDIVGRQGTEKKAKTAAMPAPAEMLASNRVGYRQHAAVPSSSNSKETSKSRVVTNRGTPVTAGMAAPRMPANSRDVSNSRDSCKNRSASSSRDRSNSRDSRDSTSTKKKGNSSKKMGNIRVESSSKDNRNYMDANRSREAYNRGHTSSYMDY